MGHFVDLKAADGFVFPAYVAKPAGQPKGGVVVLQEIFGVNAHIRAVADGYAAQGYLAVAPSTFHRLKAGVELGYGPDDMTQGRDLKAAVEALPEPGVLQDIQAAIDHAAQAGKVGVVGYCWGGLLSWRSACLLSGVSAAAPYYGGGITTEAEVARQPKCPVLAHFGDQDHWIPWRGWRHSVVHTLRCRCMSTMPIMGSTVTIVRPTKRLPQRWRANAPWHFLPSTWLETGCADRLTCRKRNRATQNPGQTRLLHQADIERTD